MREENEKFKQILATLPEAHIEVAEHIISYAEGKLMMPLSDHIHISLTDHLSFAIERLQKALCYIINCLVRSKSYISRNMRLESMPFVM